MQKELILNVSNLKTYFTDSRGIAKSVNDISFSIYEGETVGIVGESGSGKSVTALSIMRLLDGTTGDIVDGEILFEEQDLIKKSEKEMQRFRGNDISMIFQEPMTSLNPVFSVGEQIAEVFRKHQKLGKKEAKNKAVEMLRLVGIPSPEKRANQEPHELSGGMRQRVMIAIALACKPKLLIADEPTTALDVTVQAQILELINNIQENIGLGILMISHDISVIAEVCDRVLIMYAGKIVEELTAEELIKSPKHPYTIGLLNSIPRIDTAVDKLATIEGSVPSPYETPQGCPFSDRCAHAKMECYTEAPPTTKINSNHSVRCWMYQENWSELLEMGKERN